MLIEGYRRIGSPGELRRLVHVRHRDDDGVVRELLVGGVIVGRPHGDGVGVAAAVTFVVVARMLEVGQRALAEAAVLREGQDAGRGVDLQVGRVRAGKRPPDGVPNVVVFGGERVDVGPCPREVVLDLHVGLRRVEILVDVRPLVHVGDGDDDLDLPGVRRPGGVRRSHGNLVIVVSIAVHGNLVVGPVPEGEGAHTSGGIGGNREVARVRAA